MKGIAVPPIVPEIIEKLDGYPIGAGIRETMCINGRCGNIDCDDCLYSVKNHDLFMKTASKYWSKTTTGKLVETQYQCVDCGTMFHVTGHGRIVCNGIVIARCPWCRPDSKPWEYGRGE